tara:strand:- start:4668 stop:6791 length:2124 start_codon:yes stop_codon:yes gene_type:complete
MPRYIAFDFESFLIEPGVLAPKPVCMSYAEDGEVDLVTAEDCWPLLYGWLEDPEVIFVGANVGFDLGLAVTWAPDADGDGDGDRMMRLVFAAYDAGRVRDVQVRDKLYMLMQGRLSFDPITNKIPSFSLAALSERYLNTPMDKSGDTWRLRYGELDGVPIHEYPPDAMAYALTDAMTTLDVFLAQGPELLPNELEQTDAAWSLHLISMAGLEVDLEGVAVLKATLENEVVDVHRRMELAGLRRANGSKDLKALRERIVRAYEARGRPVPATEKGAVSTAGETLLASGDDLLVAMGETANAEKLLSAFIPALEAGIVNPNYDVLKETGRTSSFNPNIQQQPRKGGVREMYRPPAGHAFVDADYSTVELVALAQVCLDLFGHSKMADAINAGQDLHLVTAANILGISYEECVTRYKASDADVKDKRQLSKALNFGLPGGMGPDAFVEFARGYGLDLDRDFVVDLKKRWMEAYPEMDEYFAYISQLAGVGETFDLTQIRSGRVRGGCRYTAACNSLFQGLAADGAKLALHYIVRECFLPGPSPLYGCLPHAFVHDEVLLSAPIDRVHEAAARLEALMVAGMKHYIPNVDVRVETEAADRWSKKAQRVVDANGRLQVWTPSIVGEPTPALPLPAPPPRRFDSEAWSQRVQGERIAAAEADANWARDNALAELAQAQNTLAEIDSAGDPGGWRREAALEMIDRARNTLGMYR